jgi:hypothetical protein
MARACLLAALAALLILSSGTAYAQRESEERALRDQLADRDEYRTKLLLELQRRETLLAQQQVTLQQQEKLLQDMHAKLNQPLTEDEEDAAASAPAPTPVAAGPGGRKIKPDTPQSKRAKDFETQTYKTNLARYNVAHTRKDIAEIKALLARSP